MLKFKNKTHLYKAREIINTLRLRNCSGFISSRKIMSIPFPQLRPSLFLRKTASVIPSDFVTILGDDSLFGQEREKKMVWLCSFPIRPP